MSAPIARPCIKQSILPHPLPDLLEVALAPSCVQLWRKNRQPPRADVDSLNLKRMMMNVPFVAAVGECPPRKMMRRMSRQFADANREVGMTMMKIMMIVHVGKVGGVHGDAVRVVPSGVAGF